MTRALEKFEKHMYACISYLAKGDYASAMARLEFGHDHSRCNTIYDCRYLTGETEDVSLANGRTIVTDGLTAAMKMTSFEEIEAMFQEKLLEGSRLPPELAQFSMSSKKKIVSPTQLTLMTIASYIAKSIGPSSPDSEENANLNFGLPEDVKKAEADTELGVLYMLQALLRQRKELQIINQHFPMTTDHSSHRCTPPLKSAQR